MPFHKPSRPKLLKTRSDDLAAPSPPEPEFPLLNRSRTSISDLRSAKSGTSKHATYHEDVGTPLSLGFSINSQPRLPRVASASDLELKPESAIFSPTTETHNMEPGRITGGASIESQKSPALPTLLSSAAGKIDVEQAINLLQELRKTASPDELVSLHRALLPTKEPSPLPTPQLPSIEEHVSRSSAPLGRSRSVLPPGLATRSGLSEDPLRSQYEFAALALKPQESTEKHGSWFNETMSAVNSRTLSITSTGTAPESYAETTGAFRLGTLRVTNGRPASPEPCSVVSRLAASVEQQPQLNKLDKPVIAKKESDTKAQKPKGPRAEQRNTLQPASDGSPMSLAQRRQQQWGLRTSRPIPQLSSVVEPASHKEPVYDPTSQTKPEFELDDDKPDDRSELPSRRRQTIGGAAELTINTNVPRSQQRWNHRASHLPSEHTNDRDFNSSPYDQDKHDLSRYATQLSAIPDNEPEDAGDLAGMNACAQALLKLNGDASSNLAVDGSDGDSPEHPGIAELSNGESYQWESPIDPRTTLVRKADSGYGSEASNSPYQQPNSFELGKSSRLETTPERPADENFQPVSPDPSVTRFMPSNSPASSKFISTASSTPSQPSSSVKSATSGRKKKASPLAFFKLRNRASKRSSIATETPTNTTDFVATKTPSVQDLRASTLTPRPSMDPRRKTLQKKVPDAVRQRREEEMVRLRGSLDISCAVQLEDSPVSPITEMPPIPSVPSTVKTIIKHVPPSRYPSEADDERSNAASESSAKLWQRRSKTFQKAKQQKTIDEEDERGLGLGIPGRKRSQSLTGHGEPMLKPSIDMMHNASCTRSNTGDDQDFDSVARSLISSHPDAQGPSAFLPKAIQARRARLKSNKSRESLQRSSAGRGKSAQPHPPMSGSSTSRSVEDLYPEWKGKPAAEEGLPAAREAQIAKAFPFAARRTTVDEVVPPIPELPADITLKVSRAEEMITKKLRTSPRSSTSVRSSVNTEQMRHQPQFADTLTTEPDSGPVEMDAWEGPVLEADSKPLHRRFSFDPIIRVPRAEDEPEFSSPTHTSQHPGWPGWEKQSTSWKRHSAQLSLGSRVEDKIPVDSLDRPIFPRQITTLTSGAAAQRSNSSHRRSSTAEILPIPVASPTEENKENFLSSASYITMQSTTTERPSKITVSTRTSRSNFSTTTTTTTSTSTHPTSLYPTPQNRSSTSLSNPASSSHPMTPPLPHSTSYNSYLPYRPTDALAAERSRAQSLARRSCHIKEAELAQLQLDASPPPALPQRKSGDILDRYTGGLQYGWTREGGLVGSAGLRGGGIVGEEGRKSVKMSEEWGLDLSDVPVYWQRM